MKKFIIPAFLAFFIFISLPALSDETTEEAQTVPAWEEYCPEEYLDIKVLSKEEYAAKFPSLLPLPVTKHTLNKYNETALYWIERKKHFNEYVNRCLALPEISQGVCFSKVRDAQDTQDKNLQLNSHSQSLKQRSEDERYEFNQKLKIDSELRKTNPFMR